MSRIVGIEPDPNRARALKELVLNHVGENVIMAHSTAAAITAMSNGAADLILTSVLLSPSDDSQLTTYLRQVGDAGSLPVLIVPAVVEPEAEPEKKRWRHFVRFSRRVAPRWPAYQFDAVAGRIKDALAYETYSAHGNTMTEPVAHVPS